MLQKLGPYVDGGPSGLGSEPFLRLPELPHISQRCEG